jgi:hypothetical protein
MTFGFFTLFVALIISAIAAYYSVSGLMAIFAAAAIPIIIMGAALEVGKITAAVWLKMYWSRASITYKLYLVPAVIFLMLLTSMGIFGFLSKAHLDQGIPSGDIQAQVQIFDDKIKTQRDNIESSRRALKQMDESVDQLMARSNDERGAERSAQLRRSQQRERNTLQTEIAQAQKQITTLQEERAPIASQARKVEAEVGPVKYVAALLYGDNPDTNLLEKAVRWVIILIVLVFDPLALVLILAAQQSIRWARDDRAEKEVVEDQPVAVAPPVVEIVDTTSNCQTCDTILTSVGTEGLICSNVDCEFGKTTIYGPDETEPHITTTANVTSNVVTVDSTAIPVADIPVPTDVAEPAPTPVIDVDPIEQSDKTPETIKRYKAPMVSPPETRNIQKEIAQLALRADNVPNTSIKSSFGTQFPTDPGRGDMFLRVDFLPNKLFKFNDSKWIEVDKTKTDSYTYDEQYILFLIEKLQSGEYEIDQLSISEQELIAEKLNERANDKT